MNNLTRAKSVFAPSAQGIQGQPITAAAGAAIVLKPFFQHVCTHQNCWISAIRGARQGLYYGGKVRFAHSIVMQLLFGKGSIL